MPGYRYTAYDIDGREQRGAVFSCFANVVQNLVRRIIADLPHIGNGLGIFGKTLV